MIGWLILITLFLLSIYATYKIKFFSENFESKTLACSVYLIKIFASVLLIFIYTNFYKTRSTTDIFKYYDDAIILHSAIKKNYLDYLKMITSINENDKHLYSYYHKMNFWIKPYDFEIINENKTIIRLNALILLFSHQNYFVHVLVFVFLSFCGQVALFKFLKLHNPQLNKYILILIVFLLPSVLIWTSGILKESLISFSLGFSLLYVAKLLNSPNLKNMTLCLFFLLILLFSKLYVFLLLLPPLLSYIVSAKLKKYTFYNYLIICTLFIVLFFNSKHFSKYNLPQIVVTKQHNFINLTKSDSTIGSKINIPILEENFLSFLKNTPNALKNSIFRPFIFEAHNVLAFFCSLENLLISFILLIIIFYPKKIQLDNLTMFSISFSLLLFTLIGLTTPVLGALVRYKVPAFSLFCYVLINQINLNKIKKLIKL